MLLLLQVGPLDVTDSAPWLEDDHCCLLYSTLYCWDVLSNSTAHPSGGAGSAVSYKQLPPLAVRLRLASRAGEAVWRLCGAAARGDGSGGRRGGLGGRLAYSPQTQWQLAMTQVSSELMVIGAGRWGDRVCTDW